MDTSEDSPRLSPASQKIADANQIYVAKIAEVRRLEALLEAVTATVEMDKQYWVSTKDEGLAEPALDPSAGMEDEDIARAGLEFARVVDAGIAKNTEKIMALRRQIAAKALEVDITPKTMHAAQLMMSMLPETETKSATDPIEGPKAKKAATAEDTVPLDDLACAFAAGMVKYAARAHVTVYKTKKTAIGELIANGHMFRVYIGYEQPIFFYCKMRDWGRFAIPEKEEGASVCPYSKEYTVDQLHAFVRNRIEAFRVPEKNFASIPEKPQRPAFFGAGPYSGTGPFIPSSFPTHYPFGN